MWYTYTTEYYSAIKRNEIMPLAATRRDMDVIKVSEVSQIDRDRYHIKPLRAGVYSDTNRLIYKRETDSQP